MKFFKAFSMMAACAMLALAVNFTTQVEADLSTDTESLALFVAGDNVALAASNGNDDPPLGPVGPVGPPDQGGTCVWAPFLNCLTPSGTVRHMLNIGSNPH